MSGAKAAELEDFWQVLGLEPGATKNDVGKAYRKKSLAVHPDRYKGDNPEWATAEFLRLTRAKEVLEDDKARAAFEALQKARTAHTEKQQAQSAGRRKLREDLEAREQAARQGGRAAAASAESKAEAAREAQQQAQSETAARADLQRELERLRRTGRLGGQPMAPSAASDSATATSAATSANTADASSSVAVRAKVSLRWDADAPIAAEALKRLLLELGAPVDIDLAVVGTRAVVEMAPAAAAALSARSMDLVARGVRIHVQAATGGRGHAAGGGALPVGWRQQLTPDGKAYYYHVATRATQWTVPTPDDGGRAAPTTGMSLEDLEAATISRLEQASKRQKLKQQQVRAA